MHNIEQNSRQDDSAVQITDLHSQKEDTSTPVEKGNITTERQKLPRAWRYTIIGGTVLLVFAVIIAGLLTSANQKANPSPRIVPTPTTRASTIPTTVARESTLPTPATKPIPAPALYGYNVNVAVANGVAYLGSNNNAVYALRISNGTLLWSHKIDGAADQPPLVANGVVYAVSYVGQNGPAHIYALRASDGSLLWRYDNTNYSFLSLSTSNSNVLYVASQDGISALNSKNGTLLWHYDTKGHTSSGLPLEVNGVVYYSSSIDDGHGALYALRASDGIQIWQYKTAGFVYIPTLVNGVVYIDAGGGTLAALRASDGHQIWKQTFDANFIQTPQLVNGVLYTAMTKISVPPAAHSTSPLQATTAIGSLFLNSFQSLPAVQTVPHKQGLSSVYAIRANDGAVLWHFPLNNGGNSWASWLSVENGVVYTSAANAEDSASGGDIYAFQSSNGSVLWHDKLKDSPSGALLADDFIYLTASNNSGISAMYAVRAFDGSLLWNYPVAGSLFAAPTLDSTTIYIGATNGMIYALRAINGTLLWHYLTQVGG